MKSLIISISPLAPSNPVCRLVVRQSNKLHENIEILSIIFRAQPKNWSDAKNIQAYLRRWCHIEIIVWCENRLNRPRIQHLLSAEIFVRYLKCLLLIVTEYKYSMQNRHSKIVVMYKELLKWESLERIYVETLY